MEDHHWGIFKMAFYQIEVSAWGLGCKKPEVLIAYTAVSHYIAWINGKINPF